MNLKTVAILLIVTFIGGWQLASYFNQRSVVTKFVQPSSTSVVTKRVAIQPKKAQVQVSNQSRKCLYKNINCEVFEWVETDDFVSFIQWVGTLENASDDKWKAARIAFLYKIHNAPSLHSSPLITQYLIHDSHSPTAQYLKALTQNTLGSYQGALDNLFVLRSYYQEEVDVAIINNKIEVIAKEYIASLSGSEQWTKLVTVFDYLIQQLGDKTEFYLGKARAQQELDNQYAALDTLKRLSEEPATSSEAGELVEEIVTSLKRNSDAYFDLQEYGQQYVIPILINGKSVPMLIDTGASISTINATVAKQIGLSRSNQRINLATAGGSVTSQLYRAKSFGLKGFEKGKLQLAHVELSHNLPAVGLLGMDYLTQFQFYIDQENNQFYLNDKQDASN